MLQSFKTNDGVTLRYVDTGAGSEVEDEGRDWLVLIHGFTGSGTVWQRNVPAFSKEYRVIVPDLRGHGDSDKLRHGFHVCRLAMDLKEMISHLEGSASSNRAWKAIGGSLGCSILWCYASLFTTSPFSHMIFVDQSPLQDYSRYDDWDERFGNRGMNNPAALAGLQETLATSPETAHKGTIAACLSYRSHPLPTDNVASQKSSEDEAFFLTEAMKGNPEFYGRLMADHTSLDWRESIKATFGPESGSETKVLVVASSRSGCFPAEGPMKVVEFVNGGVEKEGFARGEVVEWGGHWCYWEDHEKFDGLCLRFLGEGVGERVNL
ncbi:alpha/beta-hydrolase [Mollisia scopiformis]|uniref:Alpha/beta-hydrolase n=1 Tax=Mollisia scopiformis TaxID=149040 RepID=A0A194XH44_MOLSC|nr:alpha/beta-hydrolase [Mollisia scopiformis]KUJ19461.1 alpha/beta-hydrolase [Mollisia scopiformis]